MPQRDVSPGRKGIYYAGLGLVGFGALLFLSTFLSAALNFGSFDNFSGQVQSSALRAVSGMICIMVGRGLMYIGRSGLAGSGLKLDPRSARKDLEPWSRMSGGMLKDTLDEAGIRFSGEAGEIPFDEQLRRLEGLRRDGLLSEEEYAAARTRILSRLGS